MKRKVKAIVEKGNCDINGNMIILDGLNIPQREIPVTKDFNNSNILTTANVFKENGVLIAEFEIDDKFLNHYPAVGIKILKVDAADDKRVISKSELFGIGVSSMRNADETILPLSGGVIF